MASMFILHIQEYQDKQSIEGVNSRSSLPPILERLIYLFLFPKLLSTNMALWIPYTGYVRANQYALHLQVFTEQCVPVW